MARAKGPGRASSRDCPWKVPGLDTAVGKSLNRFVHSRYFALCGGYGRPMARLPRSLLPDGIYHVTTRGVARTAIFLDDDDRRLFLSLLALAIRRYGWRCHAFCLMSNHYHLVVEATRAELSKGMQLLNGRYAELFNAKYRRSGHLFGDRFASRLIQSDSHLAHACAYVLANPIRAGLPAPGRLALERQPVRALRVAQTRHRKPLASQVVRP